MAHGEGSRAVAERPPGSTVHRASALLLQYYLAASALSLYQFILFNLIGFYLIPANFLLCFLIVGHPIGVLVGLRFYKHRLDAAIAQSALVLLASFAVFYLLKFFQSLSMAGLQEIAAFVKILVIIVATGAAFLPSFVAAGLIEYGIIDEAYDRGIPFRLSYATLLFGALSGLVLGYGLLPRGGLVAQILLVFLMLLAGLRSTAMGTLGNRLRWIAVGALCAGVALSAGRPVVDATFVYSILPNADSTGRAAMQQGMTAVYQAWGKYSHVIMLRDDRNGEMIGAYNNMPFWTTFPAYDSTKDFIWDKAAMSIVRSGGRVVILGSGGGRQIHTALALGDDLKIDAFEIEPVVVNYFENIAPELNGNIFHHRNVNSVAVDARKGVMSSPEPYDCIFAASAGSPFTYYKSLLLNTHLLYTTEAFASYVSKLKRDGFMAFHVNRFLFDRGMGQRIVNQMANVGMTTAVWRDQHFGFVVGSYPEYWEAYKTRFDDFFVQDPQVEAVVMPPDFAIANALPTDDWNGYFIFGVLSQRTLVAAFCGSVITLGALLLILMRAAAKRMASNLSHPRALTPWFVQALALGMNFIFLENMLIYEMTKVLLDVTDAVIVGSVLFLIPATLGALLSQERLLRFAKVLHYSAITVSLALLFAPSHFPAYALFVAEAGVFVSSGALFPLLLRRAGILQTPYVLAADALGAAVGTFVVLFIPLLYGIGAFSAVSLAYSAIAGGLIFFVGAPRDRESPTTVVTASQG